MLATESVRLTVAMRLEMQFPDPTSAVVIVVWFAHRTKAQFCRDDPVFRKKVHDSSLSNWAREPKCYTVSFAVSIPRGRHELAGSSRSPGWCKGR
jgi:hypothetical protein